MRKRAWLDSIPLLVLAIAASAGTALAQNNCAYPETRTWLRLSEEGAGFDTLWLGFAQSATCSIDAQYCEYLSIPCDPSGWFCTQLMPVCFPEPWFTMGHLDFRQYVGAGKIDTFKVRFQKADFNTPVVVRWSQAAMAALYDSVAAQDIFGGLVFRARIDIADSLVISSPAISDFYIFGYGQKEPTHTADNRNGNFPGFPTLFQNYPNPFNPTTTLSFTIPYSSFTILTVHDLLGREVARLVNEVKQPGRHEVQWDAEGLSSGVGARQPSVGLGYASRLRRASGVYFYTLKAGDFIQTRKLILIR